MIIDLEKPDGRLIAVAELFMLIVCAGCSRDECELAHRACQGDVLESCESSGGDLGGESNRIVREDCSEVGWVCMELHNDAECVRASCEPTEVGEAWCSLGAVARCEADEDGRASVHFDDCSRRSQKCISSEQDAACIEPIELGHAPKGAPIEVLDSLPSVADTGTSAALAGFYAASVHQYLYLADELRDAGLDERARIVSFWLHCAESVSPPALFGVRIAVQQTDRRQLQGLVTDPPPQVVFGPKTLATSSFEIGEWTEFPLDEPVAWDGTSNLLLEVSLEDSQDFAGILGGLYHRITGSAGRHEAGKTHSALTYPFIQINNHIHDDEVAELGLTLAP